MKIDGKVIFAKIISMTDVSKDNSLSNHFNVYQVAAAESEFKEQAILRIPKLINDSRNQASLTFERNEKEIRFPLRLEHFIHDTSKENQSNPECVTYKKPSNEQ